MSVWPPPPEGFDAPAPSAPARTLTGRAWADFALGAAGQYLTHLATARVLLRYVPTTTTSRDWVAQASVPGGFVLCEIFWATVLGLVVYYGVKPFFPLVARGSGYATLALLAILQTQGRRCEGWAFTFCKAAFLLLLLGRHALLVLSGLATLFYVLAWLQGVREWRCWAKPPWVTLFWGAVFAWQAWAWATRHPASLW